MKMNEQIEKEEEKKESKHVWTKKLNDGNNNGQATHGARKHAWQSVK